MWISHFCLKLRISIVDTSIKINAFIWSSTRNVFCKTGWNRSSDKSLSGTRCLEVMWSKESWTACRGKSSAYIVWHDEEGLRGARKSKRKRILSLARGNLKKTLLIRFSTNQRDRTRQILVVVRKPLIGSWLCKKVQKFGRRWSYTECWNKYTDSWNYDKTSNGHNSWTAGPTEPRFRLWAFQD